MIVDLYVDFPEISALMFGLEITYMRVFKFQELDLDYEHILGMSTVGLHVDFVMNTKFSG